MTRETIYAAVFAFFSALTVSGSPAFLTATRKLAVWDNVAAEDQPALLMQQKSESCLRRRGLPPLWTLNLDLYLYVHTGTTNDPTIIPSQLLNPLMDRIDAALTADDVMNDACTLGGIVSSCAINGVVEIFEGVLGDQAVCIVPITIVVPT